MIWKLVDEPFPVRSEQAGGEMAAGGAERLVGCGRFHSLYSGSVGGSGAARLRGKVGSGGAACGLDRSGCGGVEPGQAHGLGKVV